MDEAVEDGIGQGGLVKPALPMFDRELAGNDR